MKDPAHIYIERYYGPGAFGVFGQLRLEDGWCCWVLEPPWVSVNGARSASGSEVSCLPEATYRGIWNPERDTWLFTNEKLGIMANQMPGALRWGVSFAEARQLSDVLTQSRLHKGGVGVGMRLGAIGQQWAILGAMEAMAELRHRTRPYVEQGRKVWIRIGHEGIPRGVRAEV